MDISFEMNDRLPESLKSQHCISLFWLDWKWNFYQCNEKEGNPGDRFNDAAKALTYSVDRFNCELGMGDVLLRDDDNRIVTRCDRLSWAYEKVGEFFCQFLHNNHCHSPLPDWVVGV